MNLLSVAIAFIATLFTVLAFHRLLTRHVSRERRDNVCSLFRLEPSEFLLLGTDLGKSATKIFLVGDDLIGVPDALFRRKRDNVIVVGEAKSRRYDGKVLLRERYQVMFYLGVAMLKFRRPAFGILRHGCGRCIEVEFNREDYDNLRRQIPKFRKVNIAQR